MKKIIIVLLCSMGIATNGLSAQEDTVKMNEVVISSNRNVALRREAPALVNILGRNVLENTQSVCLAQGLNFQTGIRVENNCQSCEITQVRINGLDGHYSRILIDSRPLISDLSGSYILEQLPANMIERIEIVRGGGSALFGASAVGGTINIITREAITNSGEVGHSCMFIGSSGSLENNTTLNASLVSTNQMAGLYLFGQNRERDGYDYDKDGYTELPKLCNQLVGFRAFLRTTQYSKLTLQYHFINTDVRGGNRLELPAHQANLTEQSEYRTHNMDLSYHLFTPEQRHDFTVYLSVQHNLRNSYGGGIQDSSAESVAQALKGYNTTTDICLSAGSQYAYRFKKLLFMPATLTVGIEYDLDCLRDYSPGYDESFEQIIHDGSLFLQNEWENEKWSILLGGRLDKHNKIKPLIASPRINIRYSPLRQLGMRVGYAGGFRAPQAYDEELHEGISDGERLVYRLSDSLKEERSHSITFSVDYTPVWGCIRTRFAVEGFYTRLNNVFAKRRLSESRIDGSTIIECYNAYGAIVYGINLEADFKFYKWTSMQVGFTMQKSLYTTAIIWDEDTAPTQHILRTPDNYGYMMITTYPCKGFVCTITGNYTGRMFVNHAVGSGAETPMIVHTKRFFTLDMKISYDIALYKTLTLQIYGGIKNITNDYQKDFDKGWNRDSDYIYGPMLPRSYYFGLQFKI